MLGMALLLLELLRLEEGDGLEHRGEGLLEALEEGAVAGEVARLQQRGAHGDVVGRGADAAFDGAHAVADLEADVPECADQPLERFAFRRLRLVRKQHQQIDIGAGIELASPIATGGDQRCARRQARHRLHRAVNELCVGAQQCTRLRARQIRRAQGRAFGGDLLAQRRGAHEAGGGVPRESVSTS